MKLLLSLLLIITFLPECCWSGCIPRCTNCTSEKEVVTKPLDYSYDDTLYNYEI